MRFSIQREVLLKPLSQTIGVVERRQTLPVLANLLIQAESNRLVVTGTDLEVELISSIDLEIEQTGDVTIPARKLVDICKALPDGTMIDVALDGDKVSIKGGRSRFTLTSLPATEFPSLEDVDLDESVSVPTADLKTIIDRTAFAMANQDVRYYLNGLLVELREGMIRAVATDGHRLAISDVDVDVSPSGVRQLIVPRKGIFELRKMLDEDISEVSLRMGRSHIRVESGNTVFTSKLIDGRFPDYESVVPLGADLHLTGDRLILAEALQRAGILSNEKYRGVKLEIAPGKLRIIAHNPEQEEAIDEVAVDTEIVQLSVGFNVNYLLDALNAIESETVMIKLKDANSSCLVVTPDSERSRHVVMPLRL